MKHQDKPYTMEEIKLLERINNTQGNIVLIDLIYRQAEKVLLKAMKKLKDGK